MKNLRNINEEIYEESLYLPDKDDLAAPNLVSSNEFLKHISKHPILYIGQETNGWVNYDHDDMDVNVIEKAYDDFYVDGTTSKTTFWKFLKRCTDLNYNEFHNDVVWCNTILLGKRYDKGAPEMNNRLYKLSLQYLLLLYEYFEPRAIITVCGPNNPYYTITKDFLDNIDSNLKDQYPTSTNKLLFDDSNNIFWTYHPMNLCYTNNYEEISNKINQKIKTL